MMPTGQSASLKGHFLMAMPAMTDPNFVHTVTCLCEHNKNGAMGLIINRVHPEISAKDIFEELSCSSCTDRLSTGTPA